MHGCFFEVEHDIKQTHSRVGDARELACSVVEKGGRLNLD